MSAMCKLEDRLLEAPRRCRPIPLEGEERRLLVEAWAQLGYEGELPRCMTEFANAALEALQRS